MKIGVLFDRFGPYHIARIRGARKQAQILAIEGAPHRTVYNWSPPKLPKNVDYVALSHKPGEETNPKLIEQRLDQLVRPFTLDALALPGWSNMVTLTTLRWCRKQGIPAVCMSETNSWDLPRHHLVETFKRGLVSHYSSGLATNQSQKEYLVRLGLNKNAVFGGYNAVENAFFRQKAEYWRRTDSLPPSVSGLVPMRANGRYLLASNRFIPKKNLIRLLEAYAEFRQGRSNTLEDWPLVLLGDGEMRSEIEQKIEALGLESFVHLPGFLQIDELVQYYGTAGGFIHASTTEQWGLVINEAMAAGLPVAASNRCGATSYLIEDGVTGFSFDPFDVSAIAEAMSRIAALPPDSDLLDAARERVDQLRPERFGEGLINAAQAAQPSRAGTLSRVALSLAIRRAAWSESA